MANNASCANAPYMATTAFNETGYYVYESFTNLTSDGYMGSGAILYSQICIDVHYTNPDEDYFCTVYEEPISVVTEIV